MRAARVGWGVVGLAFHRHVAAGEAALPLLFPAKGADHRFGSIPHSPLGCVSRRMMGSRHVRRESLEAMDLLGQGAYSYRGGSRGRGGVVGQNK